MPSLYQIWSHKIDGSQPRLEIVGQAWLRVTSYGLRASGVARLTDCNLFQAVESLYRLTQTDSLFQKVEEQPVQLVKSDATLTAIGSWPRERGMPTDGLGQVDLQERAVEIDDFHIQRHGSQSR